MRWCTPNHGHYPAGPCGPCSELYYDFHPERGTDNASLEDDSRFIEFYNLVFMELNRAADGALTRLGGRKPATSKPHCAFWSGRRRRLRISTAASRCTNRCRPT